MKHKKTSKTRQADEVGKKCIVVTAEQLGAVRDSLAEAGNAVGKAIAKSGRTVALGTTITAISLFTTGCASTQARINQEAAQEEQKRHDAERKVEQAQSPDELRLLAGDSDHWIRQYVASNRKTPPDALRNLVNDNDHQVKIGVIKNPNAPPDVLAKFANEDGWKGVIAKNPNTPPDILAKLANDTDSFVVESVAANQNTTPVLLKKIAESPLVEKYNSYYGPKVAAKVAGNPHTPPETLIMIVQDKTKYSIEAARAIANNPNTPPEWRELVREGIAVYEANKKAEEAQRKAEADVAAKQQAAQGSSGTSYRAVCTSSTNGGGCTMCTSCIGGCTGGCTSCTVGCTGAATSLHRY